MIRIIRTGIEDIMCIHDLAEITFRRTYRDILSPEQIDFMMDWMYSPANLRKQLAEGHVYFIAFRDSDPCGYVSVQPDGRNDEGSLLFHLQKIYVLSSEQGTGIGRMLFETVLNHIHTEATGHPAAIELNVNRNNPAIGFYNHLGFRILRQGDFHIGHGFYMNDYIMGLNI